MGYIQNLKESCREVYHNPWFFLITISAAFVLFSLNAVIRNYSLLSKTFSLSLLWLLIKGTFTSFDPVALAFLLLVSIFGGVALSFSIFLIQRQIKSSIAAGASSVVVAILAPACPSCALGVLGIVGLGGVFSLLPFQGLELGVLGILLVIGSVFYLSEKIATKVCVIKAKKKKKKSSR